MIFHSYVSLPEGKPPFSYGFPMVFPFSYGFPMVCPPNKLSFWGYIQFSGPHRFIWSAELFPRLPQNKQLQTFGEVQKSLQWTHSVSGFVGKIFTGNPWGFDHQIDRAFRCKLSHHPILWHLQIHHHLEETSSPFMVRFQNRCRKTTIYHNLIYIYNLSKKQKHNIVNQISSSYPSFQQPTFEYHSYPKGAMPRWPKTPRLLVPFSKKHPICRQNNLLFISWCLPKPFWIHTKNHGQ